MFDNTEYAASGDWEPSRTLFGIRANAGAGAMVGESGANGGSCSRIIGGVSALYCFGGKLKFEPLLYYKLETKLRKCSFSMVAGAFDRRESRAFYSPAFFSSYNLFMDGTFDGIQFSWKSDRLYTELGVDWMGMPDSSRASVREEFRIYSGGHLTVLKWLDVGYAASLHHYACSFLASNVVDDALVNPYMDLEFSGYCGGLLQSLELRAGLLLGYQNDRIRENGLSIPANVNIYSRIKKWNVTIDNDLYFGTDLMPLYDSDAPEGGTYGSHLYMGEPLLRHRNTEGRTGYFDRLGIAWEPTLAGKLYMTFRVDFDFNSGFLGSRQLIGIRYRF